MKIAIVFLFLCALSLTPQQTASGPRTPQFENDDVRVWKTVILPNAPLAMHKHEHPRVLVALAGGSVKIVQQSGASESLKWETGKAYWLPTGSSQLHADVNTGSKPIEVMVVELKHEK